MLYIPYPFIRCRRCDRELPPTREFFYVRRGGRIDPLCKVCGVADARQWAVANPDRTRQKLQQWNFENRAEKNTWEKEWRRLNPAKSRARQKRYAKRHTKEAAERGKRWRIKHPDKNTIKSQRRRARVRQLAATFTAGDWQFALDHFGGCCAVCGRPPGLWHTLAQDHWIPVTKGGGYTLDNVVPLCHGADGCNNEKHDRDALEWLTVKYGKRKAAKILDRINAYFEKVKQRQA